MIKLNGKEYQLVFLDTCIVSELLKEDSGKVHPLMNFIYDSSIPCFTAHNLKELRRSKPLHEKFSVVFKTFPSFFLKEHDQL